MGLLEAISLQFKILRTDIGSAWVINVQVEVGALGSVLGIGWSRLFVASYSLVRLLLFNIYCLLNFVLRVGDCFLEVTNALTKCLPEFRQLLGTEDQKRHPKYNCDFHWAA